MSEQSDTPRTDAAFEAVDQDCKSQFEWDGWKFARQLDRKLTTATRERDEARAEAERLRGRLVGKRAIFQAGRDSYKTNCQPMNTDDEAWAEFVVSQEAKP